MVMPLFWVYIVLELAAFVALASTVGLGWTLLIVVTTFFASLVVGLTLAGSQIGRQLRRLQSGLATPEGAVSDSALVALGALLVVIPGLLSSALGLLLLVPPTRAVFRPVVGFLARRGAGLVRATPLITVATEGARRYSADAGRYSGAGRGDYIDGEVLDVTDVEPPALPPQTA